MMTNAAYKFLERTDNSFMQEKEACKQNESRVEYMFLEFNIPSEVGK